MKIYDTIDELPLYNWVKIQQTGDLKYLVEGLSENDLSENDKTKIVQAYETIEREIYEGYGADNTLYQDSLRKLKNYYLNKIDAVLKNDTLAKLMVKKYEAENKTENKVGFDDVIALLEKDLGTAIDPMRTPTRFYFRQMKRLSKQVKTK